MQDYNKGSVVPLMTVHYNGYVEHSIQGYSKCSVVPFMTVLNNG
jgi:hypothetical protein